MTVIDPCTRNMPQPRSEPRDPLLIVLAAVVGLLVIGGAVCAAYCYPRLAQPLAVGFTGVGVLAGILTVIVRRR